MADRIKLLPEVVANQIAAGEVVNRPSSVVKEMMENAIDAGARSVKVNFRDGGKELIQIVDDGCGMSPIDARMAFDRHATSKISSLDDIYALKTFGFRGEALASIAAVSQVELRTRQAEDEVGTLTTVNGGEFVSQTLAACPVGSQFYVRNLFYNVPARRKFLEKSTTSTGQIKSEFQRVALCNPQVGFELLMNDQPLYRLPAASLASRIVDVVGRHIKQNLLEVDADTSIVRVTGFVGRPAAAKKSNSSEQYLFVNGRYFRSPYFFKAILKAYEKLIPDTCSPSYFLYLTIDPSRIDVNVHPQKTEVKFADEEAVWQIINAAVRETLAAYDIRNIVLDPVMVATSGDRLLQEEAIATLQEELVPFVRVITPNIPEAEILLGRKIAGQEELPQVARELSFGRKVSVLLKAGHLHDTELIDVFYNAETDKATPLRSMRLDTPNTHGTGCTLSSAVAAFLAHGLPLDEAVVCAKEYINAAIIAGAEYEIGKGHGPVHHFFNFWE